MSRENLSVFFSKDEMECKGENCCGNSCPMDRHFLSKLDLLRKKYGSAIFISSGFRCRKHNFQIGGSVKSWHTKGRAVDCYPGNPADLEDLYLLAKGIFREVILHLESGFIHIADE